jgi:hypothetical protein
VFIATLSPRDLPVWEEGPGGDESAITPDGTRLAFTSEDSLTGYDNVQAEHGDCETEFGRKGESEHGRCREVYVYVAQAGSLVCASCDPSGARPVGGATLPTSAYTADIGGASDYRPRSLLADGTLFFNSSDELAPRASDGRRNVYEYEHGHVYAVSNVTGRYESFFLDASANGQDVFLATANQLLPQDHGGNVLVYDARVEGGFPTPPAGGSCDGGGSCKPVAAPQPEIYGPSGSATFSGPGNLAPGPSKTVVAPLTRAQKLVKALRACRRDDKRKSRRVACERQARKRFGAKQAARRSAGKASSGRRASR